MLTIIFKTLKKNIEGFILDIFRIIGHQYWLREGIRVRFIRLFYNYETINSTKFEVDYFGTLFSGNLNSFIDWRVFFLGGYEKQELDFISLIIKKISDPVFLDIGANIGTHSIYFSNFCKKVYAFEPDGEIKKKLDFNISINKINNIVTVEKALSNSNSFREFFSPIGSNKGTGSLNYNHAPKNNRKLKKVETVIGDEYINQLRINKIDFIKLDVEGHEIDALSGLEKTINRFMPILLIEISKGSIETIINKKSLISFIINKYIIFEIRSNKPQMVIFNKSKAKLFTFNWEEIHHEEINIICFPNKLNICS